MNSCLETTMVPDDMKLAIVHPLLKMPMLDPIDLTNFRPVSNLSFRSKMLEKIVFDQLQSFLFNNNSFEVFQSGFKKNYSTKTALVKVLNDILLTLDAAKSAVLVLLDLKVAFDTIDLSVFISHLDHWVGIQVNALKWFKSQFYNRRFYVSVVWCPSRLYSRFNIVFFV